MKRLLLLCLLQVMFVLAVRGHRPKAGAAEAEDEYLDVGSTLSAGQGRQIDVLVVNRTDNQKRVVTPRRTPFATVVVKKTRGVVTEEIQIASTSQILICTSLVFVPLILAWCIYFYIGRPPWLYSILLPLAFGCCQLTHILTNQSAVSITESPMGLAACQAFLMVVCTGLWSTSAHRDQIQWEGMHQYTAWFMPVTMLYAIYQISDQVVSLKCSLLERAAFTNLSPMIIFIVEKTLMPDALKPDSSLMCKVVLAGLFAGAVLYCAKSMDFGGDDAFIAFFMVLAMTAFTVFGRINLGRVKFPSAGPLAFIDGAFLMMLSMSISLASENSQRDLQMFLENPSMAILILVSCVTFVGAHVSGILLLREGSATAYAVVQGFVGLIGVDVWSALVGQRVFSGKLPAIGFAVGLATVLLYFLHTYLERMSEKAQITGHSRHESAESLNNSILTAFPFIFVVAVVATVSMPPPSHNMSPGNSVAVAARLNTRFFKGRPSNNLEKAGLLIHVFDMYDDVKFDLHSFPDVKALWDPSLRCDFPLSYANLKTTCDRVSTSVINADMMWETDVHLYSTAPGIVLAPKPAAQHVLCSFPTDGGSDAVVCDTPGGGEQCRPGCYNVNKCPCHAAGSQTFGDNETIFPHGFMFVDDCKVPINPVWGPSKSICSYSPNRLDVMMQKQSELLDRSSTARWLKGARKQASLQTDAYTWGLKGSWNEVVLGTLNPSWSEDMIEALFIQESSTCNSQRLARSIHLAMVDAGLKVPLLGFDHASSRPFTSNIISFDCGSVNSLSYSSLVIAFSIFVFYMQRHRAQDASPIVLSLTSTTMFGISNFLIGQAGQYLLNPLAHIHVMFIITGLIAYVVHAFCWFSFADYRSSWKTAMAAPVKVKLLVVSSGIMIALAQLCACISFELDSSNSGANQALTCLSVIMVSLFFYFHSGETLSVIEVVAYISILVGSLIISGMAFKLRPSMAVFWIFLSTLGYGISIITLRLSSITGVSDFLRMEVIYLVVGTVALILLPFLGPSHGVDEFLHKPSAFIWPFLNSLAELLGMWSVICAYDLPAASVSVVTAVVDSNCMVMLIMNFLCVGSRPGYDRIVGIGLVLMGQGISVFSEVSFTKTVRSVSGKIVRSVTG